MGKDKTEPQLQGNQVLRYLTDLRIHPGNEMLKNGLPVTISSDDPGRPGNFLFFFSEREGIMFFFVLGVRGGVLLMLFVLTTRFS